MRAGNSRRNRLRGRIGPGATILAMEDSQRNAKRGDVLTWTFFCRDESGIGYEFFLREWTVEEYDLVQNAPELEWPKLTWD